MRWGPVIGGLTASALIPIAVFFLAWALFSSGAWAKWENVAGEWEPYRLNELQLKWFKSVRSKQGVPCCNISDGHPTMMDKRDDGTYIPNPLNPSGEWIKVPPEAMTVPPNNPIGVATVWYVVQDGINLHIRCFVSEAEG